MTRGRLGGERAINAVMVLTFLTFGTEQSSFLFPPFSSLSNLPMFLGTISTPNELS